ncbi:MAG: GatB/YqeY domain-containing protein [Patescibacteria group bacterium]
MSTEGRITEDIKTAMREHDDFVLTTLRMLKSAIHNAAIAQRTKTLEEPDVVKTLMTQAKQRRDAMTAFTAGSRSDLADKEQRELGIIEKYLPKQLSPEEVKNIVQATITELGGQGHVFGAVMKAVMAKTAGQADGQAVSRAVKEALGGK